MKHILKCKPTRLEIRLNRALRSQKRMTAEEWAKWKEEANKKSSKQLYFDRMSIYYGHPENKKKDLGARKNWRLKHPIEVAQ